MDVWEIIFKIPVIPTIVSEQQDYKRILKADAGIFFLEKGRDCVVPVAGNNKLQDGRATSAQSRKYEREAAFLAK